MLSIPLPSRRFNKDNTRRATLFPVEQLPVFALPPLPEIKDEAALKQIFTHLSLFQKVKYKFEDPEDDLAKHYEKIEHVGDSILGMIVTTWLHEIKPGLTPGTATVSASSQQMLTAATQSAPRLERDALAPVRAVQPAQSPHRRPEHRARVARYDRRPRGAHGIVHRRLLLLAQRR